MITDFLKRFAFYRRRKSVPAKKINASLPSHLKIGIIGENIAAEYYIKHGFIITQRNVVIVKNEIDFIAEDKNYFVFCEVKTRIGRYGEHTKGGRPACAVTKEKQQNLIQAASYFTKRYRNLGKRFRFDVIEVYLKEDLSLNSVFVIRNAFSKN